MTRPTKGALERRDIHTTRVRLEARADGETPRIVGHGAVFYDGTEETEFELWRWGNERALERIMPGAFDAALERGDDVRGLFNHDPSQVLGRSTAKTLDLSVDKRGLAYSIAPGDTSVARDVIEHIRRGDVTGSSFAFRVREEGWTERTLDDDSIEIIREIREVELYDVGPVTYPAYAGADTGVRSATEPTEARASFEAWRKRQAAAAAEARDRRLRLLELGDFSVD